LQQFSETGVQWIVRETAKNSGRTPAMGGHIDQCTNPVVIRYILVTIAVVTGIVQNARDIREKNGFGQGRVS